MGRRRSRPGELVKKYWFLLGILFSILLACLTPSFGVTGGPLMPEITVKYGAIAVIFFMSGLSLNMSDMKKAAFQFRLHGFIQVFTFLIFPLCVQSINIFLRIFGVNEWVLKGLVTVSVMPPPVSTAVILTKAVGGNEAGAVFNSALGSFLGIVVTPVSLLIFLGSSTVVPVRSTVSQLAATVVLPLFAGQAVRAVGMLRDSDLPASQLGQLALLLIIYTTFCDAFTEHDAGMNPVDILVTVLLVVIIQLLVMYLAWVLSGIPKGFNSFDRVAVAFCCSHKSLTLGIPILRILFAGYSHFSSISLPLLVYHPTQIILGSLLVSEMREWLRTHQKRSYLSP
ncbi:Sodium/bile acid cotransporter 7 [Frankliniella fusca]|uniref:Sodium/bile acid cotransporter 7 n=1 Tax=Frankliniella fusca TaxID=407009 RepID=A0AAE1GR68_9NEOP|nr:Sodium/bile acid cotransporter 7 [Frankliniella fusca]